MQYFIFWARHCGAILDDYLMNERLARYAKNLLAIIAMSGSAACAASAAQARIPDWLKLRVGQSAYFDPGSGMQAVVCPTFARVVRFINSPKSLTSPKCPLMPKSGQRVTVLGWRMYEEARNWFIPIVHVRFPDGSASAWVLIGGLTPVVPRGTVVVIVGSDCTAEITRLHTEISSLAADLSACTGTVVKQLASPRDNVLVVRFNRTGTVVRSSPGAALYPNITAPNGLPRYVVGQLVWKGESGVW